VFDLLASILAFFYDLVPNYAVAIMLLTITVMVVMTPITLKGTRSMLAMQKLQPEMKRIQEMHKGDRQAANEAMMAFYKEHKINPLSGCLPMLAQIPVMIVLFNVINKLKNADEVKSTIDCAGSIIKGKCMVGDPSYLSHDSALYEALRKSGGRMRSFGVDFASLPSEAGRGAVVLYILIAAVVATSYFQLRQTQSRTHSSQMNPQMQAMNRIMPLFSGIFGFTLPGGVTLYFFVSNLYRIAQQTLMYRFDPHLKAHMDEVREVKSKAAKSGPAPAAPKKSLFAGLREAAATSDAAKDKRGANGNGAKGISKPGGSAGAKPTGRVTQPGRPGNASRKRSKRKR
jgi:YidC/Oxa1 family membrane protein insertase